MTGTPEFDMLYGPLFVGLTFAMFLYGITCAQTMYYFRHYAQDQMWLRSVAAAIWALDTIIAVLHVVLFWIISVQYRFTFRSLLASGNLYANATALVGIVTPTEFLLTSVLVFIVQGYYIFVVGKTARQCYRPLTSMLCVLAIGSFVAGVVNIHYAIRERPEALPGYGNPNGKPIGHSNNLLYMVPQTTQMALSVLTDAGITVSLCLTIRRKHSMLNPNPIMAQLSQYIVNRGALTMAIQLLQMVIYIVDQVAPNSAFASFSYMWIAFQFAGSKIYVNSFLALLNARSYLRAANGTHEVQLRQITVDTTPTRGSLLIPVPHRSNTSNCHQDSSNPNFYLTRLPASSTNLPKNEDCSESVLIIE